MEVGNRIQVYDGQFRGNILVLGKTASGKTYFIQKLAENGFFGPIVQAHWISGVYLSLSRQAEIQASFSCSVEFYNVDDWEDLNVLINTLKEKNESLNEDNNVTTNVNNSIYGENKKLDYLIVMDDVSGIADSPRSHFASFLTVSRKYRYNVVYAFHVIKPSHDTWQKIISQTNSFNIFPKSVPLQTVSKILIDNVVRTTTKYIPVRNTWIHKLFVDLSNEDKRHCLTITSDVTNINGPGRFRTQASNPEKQVCYFGERKNDELYKIFNSERIKTENLNKAFYFKIVSIRSRADLGTFSADYIFEKYGSGATGLRSQQHQKRSQDRGGDGSSESSKFYKFFRNNATPEQWEQESAWPNYLSRQ